MRRLKSLYLPAAVILMGVGAAVATNAAKNSSDDLEPGYYFDSSVSACIESPASCTTIEGAACTWTDDNDDTHNLRKFGDTMCGAPLYKPAN